MPKTKKTDINQLFLKGYRLGVKSAIEIASKTNTSLIVEKNNKIAAIKPKYKYVKVLTKPIPSKTPSTLKKKKKAPK